MKPSLLLRVLLGTATCTYIPCSGQDIGSDSKGGGVFTAYSLKAVRAEINTKEPLALSHTSIIGKTQRERVSDGELTVGKIHGFTTKLALSNSGKNIIASNLLSTKLGIEARMGYQLVVDTVSNLTGFPGTYSFGVSAITGFDNFSYYNKLNNNISHERPFNIGAEMNYNFYFTPRNTSTQEQPTRWIFAFNASVIRTWNSDELTNYQDLGKVIIAQNAVAFDKFEGRYGVLDKSFWKTRLSVSLPVYFGHFNLIPYYATLITSSKIKSTPGLNANYVITPIERYNYKFPTSLGLGIDWFDKDLKKPNLFIRGAFTLPYK